MKKVENCKLISKTEIIDGIFDFVIESEDISKEAQCGQFLHINCGDSTFLRRPISICDAENGKVRFIFEVKGKGTEELAKKEVGDYIDVMGPLGHGFEIKDSVKNAVIIGGGIGVFPLYKLAKNINADVFLGFRSKDRVVMEDEFNDVSNMVIVGTDDGSYGYNGYIASAMLNQPVIIPSMSAGYLIRMACRACTEPIGVDVIGAMSIRDYNTIRTKARNFLLRSDL